MKSLTKAEEQVMQELWDMEQAFVKEILARFPDPKPAYNTVSTIVRILEEKGFVGHEAFGKTHRYYPLVSKEDYSKFSAQNLLTKYFNNNVKDLVSFFVNDKQIDVKDLDNMLKDLKSTKTKKP